jgi:hypothetical protein
MYTIDFVFTCKGHFEVNDTVLISAISRKIINFDRSDLVEDDDMLLDAVETNFPLVRKEL